MCHVSIASSDPSDETSSRVISRGMGRLDGGMPMMTRHLEHGRSAPDHHLEHADTLPEGARKALPLYTGIWGLHMVPSLLREVWKGPKWGPKWPLLGVLLACFWRSQIEMMNLRSRSGSGSPL